MVRLKGLDEKEIVRKVRYISIPYGAIKRVVKLYRYISQNRISIPYGAIKSITLTAALSILIKFQFLMVRLKEKNMDKYKLINRDFNSLWCD